MFTAEKPKTAKCPYCSKRVSLTKYGKLYPHKDPVTKNPCVRKSTS